MNAGPILELDPLSASAPRFWEVTESAGPLGDLLARHVAELALQNHAATASIVVGISRASVEAYPGSILPGARFVINEPRRAHVFYKGMRGTVIRQRRSTTLLAEIDGQVDGAGTPKVFNIDPAEVHLLPEEEHQRHPVHMDLTLEEM